MQKLVCSRWRREALTLATSNYEDRWPEGETVGQFLCKHLALLQDSKRHKATYTLCQTPKQGPAEPAGVAGKNGQLPLPSERHTCCMSAFKSTFSGCMIC